MAGPISKVSVLLNGGIDEQSSSELAGPVATQGGSLTLRQSLNTRLSRKPGTCVRAPDAPITASLETTIYGMAPTEVGKNTLVFRSPGVGCTVLGEDNADGGLGSGDLKSDLSATRPNAFLPAEISAAGAVPSCVAVAPPAICANSGTDIVWAGWIQVNPESGDSELYVSASKSNGGLCVPATLISSLVGVTDPWVAITNHHSAGTRIWYSDPTGVRVVGLDVNGNTLSLIDLYYFPLVSDVIPVVVSGVYLEHGGTVDTTYGDQAFLIYSNGGDGKIIKFDINTHGLSILTLNAMPVPWDVAGAYGKVSGTLYLSAVFADDTNIVAHLVNPGTFVSIASDSEVAGECTVATQFYSSAVGSGVLVAASQFPSSFTGGSSIAGTSIYSFNSTLSLGSYLPWMKLYSRGTVLKLSATEVFPLLDLVPCYAVTPELPSSANYTLDPAIITYLAADPTLVTPVARFACTRGSLSPVHIDPESIPVQSSTEILTTGATQARFAWLKDVLDFSVNEATTPGNTNTSSYPGRYTQLSFDAVQPALAHDKSGVTLVAGAMPTQWDGEELVDFGGPLFQPKLQVLVGVPGTGDVYPPGSYRFGCHYEWYDAAGQLHRSAPAIIQWDSAGTAPLLTATCPVGFKDGLGRSIPRPVFFASENNGSTLHRLGERSSVSSGVVDLSEVRLANPARQLIFSTGEGQQQQFPQPPPPCLDWVIIGDRVVGIDAEVPNRLFHSKRRVSGVGFEFSPFYEMLLPSGVGDAVAIREWQGTYVVFTERAILQINGDGPDNLVGNPSGGRFSSPTRVASVGCTNRQSVLVTPKGIMFQRGMDIMMFTGGEPSLLPGVQFASDVSGAYLLPEQDEAVLVSGIDQKAFNYQVNRWTTWEVTDDSSVYFVARLPWERSKVLLAESDAAPRIRVLDGGALSQLGEMSWETDWMVLGGDFEDRVNLQFASLSFKRLSAHGVTVQLYTNYDERDAGTTEHTTERVYTASDIATLTVNGRCTLKVDARTKYSRAVKVRITETEVGEDRDGMQPICLSLYFRVEGNFNEATQVQGYHR